MARRTFLEPFEDTQLIFNRVIDTTLLRQNGITVIILVDNTAKKLYHPVLANPIHKHRTGDDVIITLNETIFDQLTDEQKEIVAHQVLAYINYDLEKEKLSIVKPDVIEHSGVVQRFGIDAVTTLRLSVESLYQQEESDTVEAEHII
jgi:hypothetical protein